MESAIPSDAAVLAGVWVEIGRARLTPAELASLASGAVVALDAAVGDAVRVYLDGRLAAQGRLVLDGGRARLAL